MIPFRNNFSVLYDMKDSVVIFNSVFLFSFKTFLLSLNDYKENEELIPNKGITFYFINEENFKKSYNLIRSSKLYDSIFIANKDYHNEGADNYIHKYNDTIIFKSY